MALYHLSVKPISRSAGRSATAAAAYRAACQIADQRTGELHDYSRKRGVLSADIVLPIGAAKWASDRVSLWNAVEMAEKRKDACVAREFEVALPAELSEGERRRLALDFAKEMADREGCAVDVAIHAPGRGGDNRNHHAHILRTTRKVTADGMGEKLETEMAGRNRRRDLEAVRERWASITNERLRQNGHAERVDHRSLEEQGINRLATLHLGPAVMGMARRGVRSDVQVRLDLEMAERLRRARDQGEKERAEKQAAYQGILDVSGDLAKAKQDQANARALEAQQPQIEDFGNWLAGEKAKHAQNRQDEGKKQPFKSGTPDYDL